MDPNALKSNMLLSRITFVGLVGAIIWMAVISSLHWERIRQEQAEETQFRMYPFTLTQPAGAFQRYPVGKGYIEACAGTRRFQLCCMTTDGTLVCSYGRGASQDTLECVLQRDGDKGYYARVLAHHPSMVGAACRLYCEATVER